MPRRPIPPQVLIVGAGPTGLTLAIDLARRGVPLRIIEKRTGGFAGSRAKGLQPRSLEMLEDLGALPGILAEAAPYPPLAIHLGPLRLRKAMFRPAAGGDAVPYPATLLIAQSRTEAVLTRRLADLGVTVDHGTQLVSMTQDEGCVTVATDGPATGRYAYVIGADGGSSTLRHLAGIAFEGSTDEADRMIIADCRISGLSRDRWHVWPWLAGRFAGACPLPHDDLFQVMIRLQPGEEPALDPDALNARWQRQIGTTRFPLSDIRWTSVFRPNIRLAARYRAGRVLLAGDAAHVHTPMGAQGMNTGMQDAYNLGWKLGQVLAGAPDALLDSYEAERRPAAASVLGLSTDKYRALGRLSPKAIQRGGDETQLTITYRAPDDAGAGLRPGDRAPDARLIDPAGHPLRLFQVLQGPHLTLLALGPDAGRALALVAWPDRGARLHRVAIDGDDRARADLHLRDPEGAFARAHGLAPGAMVLIRPDGHIAAIARSDALATIGRAVALLAPPPQTDPFTLTGDHDHAVHDLAHS